MNWIKDNWSRVALLAVVFISGAGAFYWYELRPSYIKETCSEQASVRGFDPFSNTNYDDRYKKCLHSNGL